MYVCCSRVGVDVFRLETNFLHGQVVARFICPFFLSRSLKLKRARSLLWPNESHTETQKRQAYTPCFHKRPEETTDLTTGNNGN